MKSHLFTTDLDKMTVLNEGHVTSAIMIPVFIPARAFFAFGTMQLLVKCEKYNPERGVFTPETKEL